MSKAKTEEKPLYEGPFTILPWYIGKIGLDISETAILMLICGLENSGKTCTVSNKRISEIFNIYVRKVDRLLAHLEEMEYIERKTCLGHGAIRKRTIVSTDKGRAALKWLSENYGTQKFETSFEDFWLLG